MGLGVWLRNHPRLLEAVYDLANRLIQLFHPVIRSIGYSRVEKWIKGPEEWTKGLMFDCKMCGQCILHSTGMTCPMTCPKNLRNGPCGGVRINGNCEVNPEMRCIWVEAYERSKLMGKYGAEILQLQPPVNRKLEERSAWISLLTGEDQIAAPGWE
jgi:hypothetical protein